MKETTGGAISGIPQVLNRETTGNWSVSLIILVIIIADKTYVVEDWVWMKKRGGF